MALTAVTAQTFPHYMYSEGAILCKCDWHTLRVYRTMYGICVYVMRKPWIGTIRGLPRANRGSTVCATIHGLSAQTVDPRFAQHKVRRHKHMTQSQRGTAIGRTKRC